LTRLVAQNDPTLHKQAYLKFAVPANLLATGSTVESAVLTLTAQDTSRSVVSVKTTADTSWVESNIGYATAPVGGATVATLATSSAGVSTGNLTAAVTKAGTYSLQLTSAASVSRFYSSESTVSPPTLTVTVKTLVVPPPKALLGMSSPNDLWDQRVSEVGSGLQARRLFFTGFDASISIAQQACDDGMYPIMSFKTGSYTWAQVAAGNADAALTALNVRLAALTCDVFVAVHHEPAQDGTASDWAAMQVHALPILGVGSEVKVGVIGNGWWWSATNQGYTDAEIAAYITPAVIAVSDVIAGDTYQSTTTSEEAGPKITRMGAWARRVGGVKALGVGEFNGPTAIGITNATRALGADPLFAWGCMWNSTGGIATVLTGDRLTAFRTALAGW
jgi:hypothetical protein